MGAESPLLSCAPLHPSPSAWVAPPDIPTCPIVAYREPMWRCGWLVLSTAQFFVSFGCQSDDWWEGCTNGTCVCRDFDSCDFICREPGCAVDCARSSSCGGQCIDRCALNCADVSSCSLSCGDDCAVNCSRASACNVDCRNGCRVTCSDVSSCNVRLTEGWVICERAGVCNVHCALPGGMPIPAKDCGGGRFACDRC